MRATDPVSAAADRGLGRTLEDQLHRTRDQLCLVADLFDLQAVTPEGSSDGLSAAAYAALREVYQQASHELRIDARRAASGALGLRAGRRGVPAPGRG